MRAGVAVTLRGTQVLVQQLLEEAAGGEVAVGGPAQVRAAAQVEADVRLRALLRCRNSQNVNMGG